MSNDSIRIPILSFFGASPASLDNLLVLVLVDRKLRLLGDGNAPERVAMFSNNRVMHSKGESREWPVIFLGIFFPTVDGKESALSVLVFGSLQQRRTFAPFDVFTSR